MDEWHFSNLHILIPLYISRSGGFNYISQTKKWGKIATEMGLVKDNRASAAALKANYEKILLPYDIFLKQQNLKSENQVSCY